MSLLMGINILTILLTMVASYRITSLLIEDAVLDRPREYIHSRIGGPISYLFTCYWCMGMWVSILSVGLLLHVPVVWGPLSLALTTSVVVGLLSEKFPR